MSWLFGIPWSDGLKKRACRYLLQRYLGQFMVEKLTLDQLSVDLYNGIGRVTNVSLDVQALNELGTQHNLPLEFLDGFISDMSLSVPWSALLQETSYVEVKGLQITVRPRQRRKTETSMVESMLCSMISSIQLAQECLQQDATAAENAQPIEGVEAFAHTIDSILCRVKIRFIDTVIRLEYVPLDSTTGIALELRIENFDYSDEAGSDQSTVSPDTNKPDKAYVSSAFTTKKLYFEGVTLHVDEFPSTARTLSKSKNASPDSKASESQRSPQMHTPPKSTLNTPSEFNPIMFAELTGCQEIRLKVKQSQMVQGPKIELDVTMGSLISFLSPRQVHLLLELCQGLAEPNLKDTNLSSDGEKPMEKHDFNRIERELVHQLLKPPSRSTDLRHVQGWSTASPDESENEEEFLPMKPSGMIDSSVTTNMSMNDSIVTNASFKSTLSHMSKSRKKKASINSEARVEITQVNIRSSLIAIIILHEDILTVGVESRGLTPASIEQMRKTSDDFFATVRPVSVDYGNKNFHEAITTFQNAVKLSHIRILAAPLVIEGSEKTSFQETAISGSLTLARLEVVECIFDLTDQHNPKTEFVEILTFSSTNESSKLSNISNFRMQMKYTERLVKHAQITRYANSRTEFDVILEPCTVEVDVTLIDRISTLLNFNPICVSDPSSCPNNAGNLSTKFYEAAVASPINSDFLIDINVFSPKVSVKVRFPVPDLRPLHDMDRAPWWTRSVRADFATLILSNARIRTTMDNKHLYMAKHDIKCRDLLVTYTEVDAESGIEIARSHIDLQDDGTIPDENNFGWPRMVIIVQPKQIGGPLEESSDEDLGSSLDETMEQPKHRPSPFSSTRVIHKSETAHSDSQSDSQENQENNEGEELVVPGNRQEMLEFMCEATYSAKIQIAITLPCLSVQIPSKQLYEQIYNRINTDLLLWEPSAPIPTWSGPHANMNLASVLLTESIYPTFTMCKSGIRCDSDDDSDEDGIYQSTADKSFHHYASQSTTMKGQTKLALTLNVPQGVLSMYTPVRDSMSNVIPGQQGELIVRMEDATIFCVNSYKGDNTQGYISTFAKAVSLNHCGLTTIPSTIPPLRSINSVTPKSCHPSIYQSQHCPEDASEESDMLTVAVKIQAAHDTRRIKTFRVAVGIRNATLRHRMSTNQMSWFSQLIDVIDVNDHPVAGYSPPGVLTELHLHLWNCSVDYRPIYLPLRSMVTFGNVSVASNIVAKTHTSTLKFIAEDVALFISEKQGNNVDLTKDYICVVDLGLFELSLRLNEKVSDDDPRIDLRVSNNILHVRTCADSARALTQLLTYLANDGDLAPIGVSTESVTVPSSTDGSLLGDESINTLSKSQEQRINSLMEEAMEDTVIGRSSSNVQKKEKVGSKVEVFFFPDEFHPALIDSEMSHSTMRSRRAVSSVDSDDDFCIIGDEAGAGIIPRHGVPEIRWLSQEAVRIVENHFALPTGKADLLKAPKHFPKAILKYTLCEMTVIWHMYGGKDFGKSSTAKKRVTIEEGHTDLFKGTRSRLVSASFNKANEIHFNRIANSTKKYRPKSTEWYTKGGPGRQHHVLMELQLNKVKFQHETYPEDTTEASRQVLLINDIEIRDRLASSDINKFLYQYHCEARPKQAHANMFTIKAVHMRPDPKLSAQECCLKISLRPVRLHMDQDSLLFLINFFTDLSGGPKTAKDSPTNPQSCPGSKQSTPTHRPPVMSVNDDSRNVKGNQSEDALAKNLVDENLMLLLEDELTIKENATKVKTPSASQDNSQPIYFRSVVFEPEVLVRLDYHGKRVDLTHGPLAGLLMGLAQLNCSELKLKKLIYRHGLLGINKLINYLMSEWLQDIKKNQLPSILGGVGPLHSLLQLLQGIKDLFWMPIEQYQKDGRIVRGLQRGANSFSTSTAMATLELTTRLINAIQSTAETAYDMVSPGPSVRCGNKGRKGRKNRYNQPLDIREGVNNAYTLVKEGLGETAHQLVRVASEEHEQKGVSGAVGGVLRQIPPTVVKPIILATEATNNVLGGMKSQLVPDARREAVQKWRQEPRNTN